MRKDIQTTFWWWNLWIRRHFVNSLMLK